MAAAVLAAGSAASLTLARQNRESIDRQLDARFAQASAEVSDATTAELTRYEDVAQAAAGLFAVEREVTPTQFRAYVDALDLTTRYPDALALLWAQPLEGGSGTATLRLLEPISVCPSCIGLPAGDVPAIAESFDRADRTGLAQLSPVLDFGELIGFDVDAANGERISFLIVAAHLQEPGSTDGPLVGWVAIPLYGAQLADSVLLRANVSGVALSITQANAGENEVPVSESAGSDGDETSRRGSQYVSVYGQRWRLDLSAEAGFVLPAEQREPTVVLLGGLALSALLALVVGGLLRGRHNALAHAAALGNREDRLRRVFVASPVAMVELGCDASVHRWNPAASMLFGWPDADGAAPASANPSSLPFGDLVERVVSHDATELDVTYTRDDGISLELGLSAAPLRADDGSLVGVIAMVADITERTRLMAELEHLAGHDHLTGLPNRALLVQRVEEALARARRGRGTVGVLYCDLDRFKVVNDTLGHRVGDIVLSTAAQRLGQVLRETDTLARLGGDEFVVCSEGVVDLEAVAALAGRLQASLAESIDVDGRPISVGVSIGVALSAGTEDAETLLRRADLALYWAKDRGRGRVEIYDRALDDAMVRRRLVESTIGPAISAGDLGLVFQPQIDLASGDVVAVEALARWEHPKLGSLSPTLFVAVAEELGFGSSFGRWVLGEACRWRADQVEAGSLQVAINVSVAQLGSDRFVEDVQSVLADTNVDPSWLCLEVAEGALADVDIVRANLDDLRSLGVTIALDDLGTGSATLSSLRDLPLDLVKLDGSLLAGITDDRVDRVIVGSLVRLAHDLGLVVVAEGLETQQQLDAIRSVGVDRAQGYLFAQPEPAERLVLHREVPSV